MRNENHEHTKIDNGTTAKLIHKRMKPRKKQLVVEISEFSVKNGRRNCFDRRRILKCMRSSSRRPFMPKIFKFLKKLTVGTRMNRIALAKYSKMVIFLHAQNQLKNNKIIGTVPKREII